MSRLKGQIALVTGASKGTGAEIAREFAAAGAAVVVNYATDRTAADAVVQEISAANGRAVAIQGDVAKSGDVSRLFAEVKRVFGSLDVVVNNAGGYVPMRDRLKKGTGSGREDALQRSFAESPGACPPF